MCPDIAACTEKEKSIIGIIQRDNRALYNETRKHFEVMKATKKEAWRNKWREFWSGAPREIWHFIRQLMGRGGSGCDCAPEEISAHFCDVGKPPDDPDFCMNCLAEAQRWIAENVQHHIDASPGLPAESNFSTREVIDGFKQLKNSALGLDGISKSIIFPILAIISPAVAMLFTALLRFSVSPSDWRIAVLAQKGCKQN